MVKIAEKVKEELLEKCEESKKRDGYDFWNEHIKYVVENAIELAKQYKADEEIVELGALLHDIAMPAAYGPREEHHIYGAKMAEELLRRYEYPEEKIQRVKDCILHHRGSQDMPRNTIEEQCVADADVIAHFDCIPSLFSLAFKEMKLSIPDGTAYVEKKLERDFNKLSPNTKVLLQERYENIRKVLFRR